MLKTVLPTIILIVFSAICIGVLYAAWVERLVKKKGTPRKATVQTIRRTIPVGFRRVFTGKDGAFPCDYLLTLRLDDGRTVDVTARARIKIKAQKRFLYFAEGDTIEVRMMPHHPRTVIFSDAFLSEKQGRLSPIILWLFCSLFLLLLLVLQLSGFK